MTSPSMGRKCYEGGLEFLLIEMTNKYTSETESTAHSKATLEAIGSRVGKQLIER